MEESLFPRDERRVVFISPCDDCMHVIVEHPTGVVYQQQYGGVACRQGRVEGYLVPVEGAEVLPELRRVFELELHGSGAYRLRWSADLLGRVIAAVESIPYFMSESMAEDGTVGRGAATAVQWAYLRVDRDRLDDLDEAWVPVHTMDGPGYLVWVNSD